jgi:hypothetical protein
MIYLALRGVIAYPQTDAARRSNTHLASLTTLTPLSRYPIGMYWTTWIASIKDVPVAFEERVDTKQDKGMAMKVRTPAADIFAAV